MAQLFPRYANALSRVAAVILALSLGAGLWATSCVQCSSSASAIAKTQPLSFSHQRHVGELGIDCRYCHDSVETSAFAGMPSTATCMSCHRQISADSPLLEPVRSSFKTATPLQWTRVHDLPDFTYFDHSVHLKRGVGCASCHGRVDQMPLMRRHADLSMGWCLDCHRDPTPHLRPTGEVFNMAWKPPEDQTLAGKRLADARHIQVLEGCSYCHR
jgi:hypothetical protein